MRSSRGFTLLEGLFSLFLVALVLGGIVHTLNQAAQVKRNTKNLDQTMEEFHVLMSLQSDLNAAVELSQPLAGQTSSVLTLRRVNPSLSFEDRTSPLSSRVDAHLNPFEDLETVVINYALDGGYLVRSSQVSDEDPKRASFQKMESFRASRNGGSPFFVTLEIVLERERVQKTRSLTVSLKEAL